MNHGSERRARFAGSRYQIRIHRASAPWGCPSIGKLGLQKMQNRVLNQKYSPLVSWGIDHKMWQKSMWCKLIGKLRGQKMQNRFFGLKIFTLCLWGQMIITTIVFRAVQPSLLVVRCSGFHAGANPGGVPRSPPPRVWDEIFTPPCVNISWKFCAVGVAILGPGPAWKLACFCAWIF